MFRWRKIQEKGLLYILNTTVTISKKALQEIRGSDTNQNTLPINYQSIHEHGSTNEQLPRRYLSTGHFARGLSLFMTSLLNRPLSHKINKWSEIITFLWMKSDHNTQRSFISSPVCLSYVFWLLTTIKR